MKRMPDRDWPATIVLTVLVVLTVLLVTLDRSCQVRRSPVDAIPTR